MSLPWLKLRPIASRQLRFRCFSTHDVYQEGDYVLAKSLKDQSKTFLFGPLKQDKKQGTHQGDITHAQIIGKSVREIIMTHKGKPYRLHTPTLEEYVSRVKRLVTPIYPLDASCIVSHMDINISHKEKDDTSPPVELFESGTGHGSLSLALAKEIAAANPPGHPVGAVLHTVDISAKNSAHAEGVVKGFRRGLYYKEDCIKFHVNTPDKWVEDQFEKRGSTDPFLSFAFLDLPDAHKYLQMLSNAMKTDAVVGIFVPSITQIGACVREIKDSRIPLTFDKCIELGPGISGGREWDVRLAQIRASVRKNAKAAEEAVEAVEEAEEAGEVLPVEAAETAALDPLAELETKERWEMVCRPAVGRFVVGGGFFAMFRRLKFMHEPIVGMKADLAKAKAEKAEAASGTLYDTVPVVVKSDSTIYDTVRVISN
ncbi:hypothetical protein BJ508DRAFT_363682 [Ascobolus immersus RN42]|uniref:tRNA (adenine(58)-N(1))-methyltransferase catalytic subunit TRM61 n=1 Tax=Ascobolus immersus RN42 TaxID=1160509 RepID=A0A3N4HZW3_ASCIM|nr:hypothetical protein BJ508DRAFT_363682 [Ascobolus immersus RN42]